MALRRLILANHRASEVVSSNVQALLNFLPGRYGEHELFYESIVSVLQGLQVLEDVVVLDHVRRSHAFVRPGSDESRVYASLPRAGLEAGLCTLLRQVSAQPEQWHLLS